MCIKWMKKLVRKLEWCDIALIKGTVFFATLFLITVWPAFLELVMRLDWYWYLVLTIVFAIPVFKKAF